MTQMDKTASARVHKVFVVCNQRDTAPIWRYVLHHQGLCVSLESSFEKAVELWSTELPDLVVLDVMGEHEALIQLCLRFRSVCTAPLLVFLPAYHESEILDAYAAGADEVVVKPISPAIFLAKILAWGRRCWILPMYYLPPLTAGNYHLEPARRCMLGPYGSRSNLSTLEFRLLHLLMSRPGRIFAAEEIIHSLWGGFGSTDQVLLKNLICQLQKKIEVDPARPTLLRTWPNGHSFHG